MVKEKKYGISLLNDDRNSFQSVISALQDVMCYDITRAHNIANIVHYKGEYVLKWYESENTAISIATTLKFYGLRVKLIVENKNESN